MKVLSCGFFPALQRTVGFSEFRLGEVNRSERVVNSVGGKSANVARVLKPFEVENLLFGFSGGNIGAYIKQLLDSEKIPYRFIETVTETRICQTVLDDNADDFTEIIEDSAPLSQAEWQTLRNTFAEIESDFDFIVFSGTLPSHAPVDIYAELISLTDSAKVLLDTSGEPLLAALEQSPAIVKINADELVKTLGIEGDIESLSREMSVKYGCAAGITHGGGYALLAENGKMHRYNLPQVDVISTLGCGDSVNAGITVALVNGKTLPDAFKFGLACGSANATTPLPGMVDAATVAQILPQIVRC